MVFGDFKDIAKRYSDKLLRDKRFTIAKSTKYGVLLQWFINVLLGSLPCLHITTKNIRLRIGKITSHRIEM